MKLFSLFFVLVLFASPSFAFVKVIESWGGQGIQLYVYDNKTTHMELDCAYANTSSWDIKGETIRAEGSYNIDPQSIATPDIPIVVEAQVSGKKMNLQFSVEGQLKQYQLEKDVFGKVDWCD